jgi:hypothetical protein|tara:strand:+ start:1023 stop:1787 length:765 start_codon:yes stop_codon:yes gene_type:complete
LKKKSFLIPSLLILLFSVVIVATFGIIPLPEYSTESNLNLDGEIFYSTEIQSSNIIPPAPDIMDQCIFKVDISKKEMTEKKVVCTSDLYQYSYDVYLNDIEMDKNENLILRYWNNLSNSEMALIIDTENSEINLLQMEEVSINRSMYEINSLGEKLLTPWEMREVDTRTAGVYYQKNSEIIEVFKTEAPTSYYFESLIWSPDGMNILGLDTENDLIIFSKDKIFDPIRLTLKDTSSSEFEDDEVIIYQIIGWSN